MDIQELRRWTRREPFEPFQIRLHDGTVYRIPALGMCMPCAKEVVVGVARDSDPLHRPRYSKFVNYDHIAAVEPLSPARPTGAGGSAPAA